MGGWVTGQKPLVHAHPALDPHEEWHLCTVKFCPRRHRILGAVDVPLDDGSLGVDVIPIEGGRVVLVFLHDFETAQRRSKPFAPRRNRRDPHQFARLVEVGALMRQLDHEAGRACHAVAVPVGVVVEILPGAVPAAVPPKVDGVVLVAEIGCLAPDLEQGGGAAQNDGENSS